MWAGQRAGNFRAGCECGAPAAVGLPWIRRREPLAACSAPLYCCCCCRRRLSCCCRRRPRAPASSPPPSPQVGASRVPTSRDPPATLTRPARPHPDPSSSIVRGDLGKLCAPRPGPSWPTSGPGRSRRGRTPGALESKEPRSTCRSRDAECGAGGPGKPRGGARRTSTSGSGGARARRRPGTLGRSRCGARRLRALSIGWGVPEGFPGD